MGRDFKPILYRLTNNSFNPRAHVGRDGLGFQCYKTFDCFNPRAHVGRDLATFNAPLARLRVSIHAPTWGATLLPSLLEPDQLFQSTRPRGARLALEWRKKFSVMFQSTRPRGARHSCCSTNRHNKVSIHAPTWGATGSNV